ncbi:MAG: ribonuclease domain-containing protein [Coprococcus sp.]
MMKKVCWVLQTLLITMLLIAAVTGCGGAEEVQAVQETAAVQTEEYGSAATEDSNAAEAAGEESAANIADTDAVLPDEDGSYTSREDVALYIHTYGKLPENYMTKKEAQALGWDNKAGNLWDVAPGMSIGGDRFGNYEGLLPDADGRKYYECDIDYEGGYRGSKRIIFSNDGLIYYTEDHYESFEQLYE